MGGGVPPKQCEQREGNCFVSLQLYGPGSDRSCGSLSISQMLGSLDISKLLGDGDDASGLPNTGYSEEEGFTWVDTLRSVDCDSSDRKALCVEDRTATMVTAQVLTSQDTCVLKLRLSGNGHQLAFGIVDENPSGFSRLAIGDERLQSSIGAMCSPISGTIVYEGNLDWVPCFAAAVLV